MLQKTDQKIQYVHIVSYICGFHSAIFLVTFAQKKDKYQENKVLGS